VSAPEPGDRGPAPRPTPPRGRDAWEVYERLLADVPAGPRIAECTCGLVWTLVQAETGAAGIALTFADGVFSSALPGTLGGLAWRDLAAGVTNWNLFEAGLGTAALNAHFNDRARVEALLGHAVDEGEQRGVFALLAERFAGGRVAVVGHFPDLSPFAQACELTILERRPRDGDLPDQACEYVLPRQDCVCITGSAFTNKTLAPARALAPRLRRPRRTQRAALGAVVRVRRRPAGRLGGDRRRVRAQGSRGGCAPRRLCRRRRSRARRARPLAARCPASGLTGARLRGQRGAPSRSLRRANFDVKSETREYLPCPHSFTP